MCVIVVTPSLNKSFKFQSDWPHNNSQVYLLGSLIEDLKNDDSKKIEEKDDGYILTSLVNYPNNKKLVKQKIYLNKKYEVSKVEVVDEQENVQIQMNFNKVDLNAKFNDNHFNLNELINDSSNDRNTNENNNTNQNTNTNTNENSNSNLNNAEEKEKNDNTDKNNSNKSNEDKTENTATIEDIIYPMYLPTNTYLANQEKVNKDDGQRLILTFAGDNPFMLIEETVSTEEEHVIIPTFGEITQLSDTLGVVNDNSVNWFSNGIEYFVVSDKLSTQELLEVARSISVLPVSK